MILKNLLTEYRNGNEEAVDKLFEEVIITDEDNSYIKQIKIYDIELLRMVYSILKSYIRKCKKHKKWYEVAICISTEDIKAIFISELYNLFNDRTFNSRSEYAIFKALKNNINVHLSLKYGIGCNRDKKE